jgi:hypothetical protein
MEKLFFPLFIFLLITGIFLFFGIWIAKITKKHRQEIKKEKGSKTAPEKIQPQTLEMTVKVINQTCSAKMVGIKTPKAVNEFIITFEKSDGEIFSLSVPEECYDGFEIGQTGRLTTINGELYGFELE